MIHTHTHTFTHAEKNEMEQALSHALVRDTTRGRREAHSLIHL